MKRSKVRSVFPAKSQKAFVDFTAKLSAKWKLRTQQTPPTLPKVSDNAHLGLENIFRQLIAIPTTTGDYQANHDALDYIEKFLTKYGMQVTRLEWNGIESLVASPNGTKTPKVMLGAHLDVVPGPHDMFELREEAGNYLGRGVLDMKFAIASYMQLVYELRHDLSSYDFGIMITTDEEAGGMDGVAKLVEAGYLPGVCVLPDGGMNWQIQLFSKGFFYLSIKAKGVSGHGSRPWLGENAIDKLLRTLHEVRELFPDPGTDPDTTINTINIGKIRGGEAVNQIADTAEVLIDIRYATDNDKEHIARSIADICAKHETTMEIVMNGDITDFKRTDPHIDAFAAIITEVTGVKIKGSRTPAGSDIRYYAPYKVPCVLVYPPGGGHHGPKEWVSKQGVHQFHEIIKKYLETAAR